MGIICPLVKYPLQFDEELYETMDVLDKIQKYQEFIIGDISNTFLSETVIPMAQAHAAYKGKNMNIAWDYVSLVKANDWQNYWSMFADMRYGTRLTPVRLDARRWTLRRYHTWPIIGQQTIAEHCWQLMRIYMCVVDKLDIHMIRHIQFHDIGEHFTGDIPYPVKHDNPKLKEPTDPIVSRCKSYNQTT